MGSFIEHRGSREDIQEHRPRVPLFGSTIYAPEKDFMFPEMLTILREHAYSLSWNFVSAFVADGCSLQFIRSNQPFFYPFRIQFILVQSYSSIGLVYLFSKGSLYVSSYLLRFLFCYETIAAVGMNCRSGVYAQGRICLRNTELQTFQSETGRERITQ